VLKNRNLLIFVGERHKRCDEHGKRWCTTNADDVPENALLHLPRSCIRLCVFHAHKRIFELLLDLLLEDWFHLGKLTLVNKIPRKITK